jgi:hypothetical protein
MLSQIIQSPCVQVNLKNDRGQVLWDTLYIQLFR